MNVDEMDLVGQALEVTPWRPETYEGARTKLRAALSEAAPEGTPVRQLRPATRRRIFGTRGKIGLGAGIGAIAAAAAVAVAVGSSPQPVPSAAPESPLISLAAYITASPAVSGNASLVVKTQTIGNRKPEVSYGLYTDGGGLFVGGSKKNLMEGIARKEDLSSGIEAREVKAALLAAKGDLAGPRKAMVNASPNALGLGLSAADRQTVWDKAIAQNQEIYKAKGVKIAAHPPTGKLLEQETGNWIWNNSVDALTAGAGNAQVRAGVLRLLSTVPEVKVAKTTTGGTATLTLTAGSALFQGGSPEVLTINAKTGMPIKSSFKASGGLAQSVATFQVSRVTLKGSTF